MPTLSITDFSPARIFTQPQVKDHPIKYIEFYLNNEACSTAGDCKCQRQGRQAEQGYQHLAAAAAATDRLDRSQVRVKAENISAGK